MRAPIFAIFPIACLLGAVATKAAPTPLTLDEAIQKALGKNYAIRVDSFSVPIAKAGITIALGKFDPSLDFSYNYNQNGSPQPSDPFSGARSPSSISDSDSYQAGVQGLLPLGTSYQIGVTIANQRSTPNLSVNQYYSFAGITLRQPILRDFGFAANLEQVRVARADRRISEWQYRQTLITTITNVMNAYYELAYAKQNLLITQRSRDLASNLVSENERRFKVGTMSEYDVTSARARAASREEAILFAERSVIDRKNQLKQLISDDRSQALLAAEIDIAALPDPAFPSSLDSAAAFRQALLNRPDYQQLRSRVQRARAQKESQQNQLLPRVDFVGSYGYNGIGSTFAQSRRSLEDRESVSWGAGAELTVPITFAKERGNYRQAKLQLRQTEAQLEQMEQDVLVKVGNAAGQIETTQKRLAATRIARQLAQQTLDAEFKKLRAGTESTFNVLYSQELLIGAQDREVRTLADALEAIADFDQQIGVTLEKHRVSVDDTISPAKK